MKYFLQRSCGKRAKSVQMMTSWQKQDESASPILPLSSESKRRVDYETYGGYPATFYRTELVLVYEAGAEYPGRVFVEIYYLDVMEHDEQFTSKTAAWKFIKQIWGEVNG